MNQGLQMVALDLSIQMLRISMTLNGSWRKALSNINPNCLRQSLRMLEELPFVSRECLTYYKFGSWCNSYCYGFALLFSRGSKDEYPSQAR